MATDLTDLATARRWKRLLSDHERDLVTHAARGEPLDLRTGDAERDAVDHADEWDGHRVIRARVLEILLLEERDDWPLHHRGVAIFGAYIDGQLDLDFGTIGVPIGFVSCAFTHPISMQGADIKAFAMRGSRLPSLDASTLNVRGGVFLSDGFSATGGVRLHGATIGGQLNCARGSFTNKHGYALDAELAKVTGSVFLSDGFSATGGVRLLGATIGGQLNCARGSFTNKHGYALDAAAAKVTGSVFLSDGFRANGQVSLHGATIRSQLACRRGSFTNTKQRGYALTASRADISGSVFLSDEFSATGVVDLGGAKIGGQLNCERGSFTNERGYALAAQSAVAGDLLLFGATFDGQVDWRGASVALLEDEIERWPTDRWHGDGFTYRDFAGRASTDVGGRLEWLARQRGEFRPGAYTHLAAVYRRRGDPDAGRRVLAKRESRRTGELALWRRPVYWLWGMLSAYGYRPWRAVLILVALIAISGSVFDRIPPTEWSELVGPDKLVGFNAWLYAADLAVPLVDLRQAADYQPPQWAQSFMYATIGLGWLLSLAAVAAVTGIFKPDE